MNLVVNARDAMPTGGRLRIANRRTASSTCRSARIRTAARAATTILTVSDTGCGMDARDPGAHFRAVLHHQGGRQGNRTGTGHGLRHRQAERRVHRSRDDARRRQHLPDLFPANSRCRTRRRGQAVKPVQTPRGRETILLVEDEDGLRELAQMMLEASGYKVLSTRSGGDAVRLCSEYTEVIDLLFTDVVMPEMSGRQLADLLVPSPEYEGAVHVGIYRRHDGAARHPGRGDEFPGQTFHAGRAGAGKCVKSSTATATAPGRKTSRTRAVIRPTPTRCAYEGAHCG